MRRNKHPRTFEIRIMCVWGMIRLHKNNRNFREISNEHRQYWRNNICSRVLEPSCGKFARLLHMLSPQRWFKSNTLDNEMSSEGTRFNHILLSSYLRTVPSAATVAEQFGSGATAHSHRQIGEGFGNDWRRQRHHVQRANLPSVVALRESTMHTE